MIIGTDGKLYGTTYSYGEFSGGTVWNMNTDGSSFSVLHSFNQTGDGYSPYAGVLEGPAGNLYGTTYSGGIAPEPATAIAGTVYKLEIALPIVSSFSPTSGSISAGTAVTLKGFNLTNGAVSLDGVAQTVTSSSATALTFKLTTGTPTGSFPIMVTTATGSYSTGTKLFKVNP